MKAKIVNGLLFSLLMNGCATRTRSLTLGGAGGVALGAAAGALARGDQQSKNAVVGAGIGLAVGIITSYLLHEQAEERLESLKYENDERLRFGDLPPNPFSPANQNLNFKNNRKEKK